MKKAIKWTAIGGGFVSAFLGLMFLHFFIITEGDFMVAPTVDQDPSLSHIHLGNRILHGETFGNDSNQTVIVLHGGPGADYRYMLPLRVLEDEYFLVFYDQLGSGLSPRVPVEELSIEHMVDDLHQIVNSYSPGNEVYLIGHSWGALLASSYAAAYPNRAAKIVLAEPWIRIPDSQIGRTEMWKSWFRSLHVKGPDKYASSDYFLSAISTLQKTQEPDTLLFWRYGSLARKTLIKTGLEKEGNVNLGIQTSNKTVQDRFLYIAGELHSIPMTHQLIDPFNSEYPIRYEMIQGADRLFGEKEDQFIATLRQYLNE